jgi:hypothetical protein
VRAVGSDPKQVTIQKLSREQMLAAQAAGLTIPEPQLDRTRSRARDQAGRRDLSAEFIETETADNPRRLKQRHRLFSGVLLETLAETDRSRPRGRPVP